MDAPTATTPPPDQHTSPVHQERWRPQAEPRRWQYIILHHSATPGGSVESIDAAHRRRVDSAGRPWLGIGYHFVVGNGRSMAEGDVEPTFRWQRQLPGAHAGDRRHNDAGIGVCLVGDFRDQSPSNRQLAAAVDLVAELARRYDIPAENILRHSDVAATECPGPSFPLDAFRSELSPPERK